MTKERDKLMIEMEDQHKRMEFLQKNCQDEVNGKVYLLIVTKAVFGPIFILTKTILKLKIKISFRNKGETV